MCLCALINEYITTEGVVKAIELGLATWGCYIAYRGLQTWREQILEAPKIELAREIVEQFYNMKDLISRARCPFISYSPEEVRKYYEKSDLSEFQTGLGYRLMILDTSIEQIQTFQRLRNKAKVYYSKEIENCFFEVNRIINHFKNACLSLMREDPNQSLTEIYGKDLIKEFNDKIYEHGDDDAINTKLQEVINEVEYNLKPIYKSKSIKWKKLNSTDEGAKND
ncbi:MAG: hypothetical protein MJ212_01555 [Alphaproteobacteria bacterium]|nr:hypothetical protein [Alphaproteobacteria bacterium]